ncbi:hypothetical protein J7E99_11830 [Streptomyces sp. ISL-44]|uniref:hypothetical protein n=1 Tax=Streptomyces sp. ISL-44 TaxID=2819184 RepID=UPI001BED397E|nr:hypothetical protein [Streptomyces sp. ISL-44]MBT2541380.1 hypothetical protein [Streptomyces sp. ISL-44]
MQEYQGIVRVRHAGLDLAVSAEALDTVTGELVEYGATAQLWPDVSEWTMTVRVPSLWDVAAVAGRAVRAAYEKAGHSASVVRVDAWNVTEWEQARGLSD